MSEVKLDIHKLASVAAMAAKRRYPWADIEDLTQESAVAMLKALPKHNAARGNLEPYLLYAAWYRLRGWVWEDGVVRQRPDRNRGWALRAPIDEVQAVHVSPEMLLQRAQLSHAVQRVLERCSLVAALVLTGEAKAAALAFDLGYDPAQMRCEVAHTKMELHSIAKDHLELTL